MSTAVAEIGVDYKAWADGVDYVLRHSRKTVQQVLNEEKRPFVRDLAALTPPTGNAPLKEKTKEQQRFGNLAIARDVRKLFINADELKIVQKGGELADTIRKYVRRGEVDKLETLFRRLGVNIPIAREASAIIHKYSRNNRGRTLGSKKRLLLRPQTAKRLITELQKKVGMAKAGWKAAASGVKENLPVWVTRHSSPGYIIDGTMASAPFIEVGNEVSYAQKHNRTARIMKIAIERRGESLKHRMDYALGKAFSGYGKTKKYAK